MRATDPSSELPLAGERLQAKARPETKVGAQPDFIVLTDPALRYVHAAGAAAQWFGAPLKQVLGASARDFFTRATSARHETMNRRVMRSGKALLSQLDLSVRTDGTWQWANISRLRIIREGVPCVATNGRLMGPPMSPALAALAEVMRKPFDAETTLAALAARTRFSVQEMEAEAQEEFGLRLSCLVTKLRLDRVTELVRAGLSISDAAYACGYATQSALSRRFRAVSGMAPTEFCRLEQTATPGASEQRARALL
jgi:AraC-like DNA-binding protein